MCCARFTDYSKIISITTIINQSSKQRCVFSMGQELNLQIVFRPTPGAKRLRSEVKIDVTMFL